MTTIYDLPKPSEEELNRSQALSKELRKEIEQSGPISFERWMGQALYHPNLGYYEANSFNLGKGGDFTTAPEISPLFAACFASEAQAVLSTIKEGSVLELGAGTGRFAGDFLSAIVAQGKTPCPYFIYEISLTLRKKQQDFIKAHYRDYFKHITWLSELPRSFTGVVIANEVLDALPCTLFVTKEEGIKERRVGVHQNEFAWTLAEPSPSLKEEVDAIAKAHRLPKNYSSEVNLQLPNMIRTLGNMLKEGVILLCDYGYGEREYYHPQRTKGTLTCFYRHRHHDNPLILVGIQDITAHVNFTALAETALKSNLFVKGYTTQGAFLLSLGLMKMAEEAEKTLTQKEAFELHQSIKLLTLPVEMGERIKIMALEKNFDGELGGFSLQDRRRDL